MRSAKATDASAIAAVYNQGIAGRESTFETEACSAQDFIERIGAGQYPVLVAELNGRVVGCAWISRYSDRPCYAGVGECSVYVAAELRGRGIGSELLGRLAEEAERRGFYKLLGKLFPTNQASVSLVQRCRFHQVGLHRCHGQLDGQWRDVLLVERLLGNAASVCGH